MSATTIQKALLISISCTGLAHANCEPAALQSAKRIVALAQQSKSLPEKTLLLNQVQDNCRHYDWQMAMGTVFYEQQQWQASANAFQQAAVVALGPSMQSNFQATALNEANANQWLATVLLRYGKNAEAAAVLEQSRLGFQASGIALNQNFLDLQGELDDKITESDVATLSDAFAIQRTQNTRGIGVRSRIKPVQSSVATPSSDAATLKVSPSVASQVESLPNGARLNIQVLFETASDQLAIAELDRVSRLAEAIDRLSLSSDSTIYVVGHTDKRGADSNNKLLSERRAKTVATYISSLITTKTKLVAIGNGESELRYPGNTLDSHRRNRRVEILIVEN